MLTSNPNKVRIHSQKIAPGLEASNQVRDVKPGPERSEGPASSIGPMCKREPERSEGAPSQRIGRELGTHKRSHPDLKHLTKLEMSSPDLNEVRVQRLTSAACVSANPNQVRVRGQSSPSFSASFGTHLNATWYHKAFSVMRKGIHLSTFCLRFA